MKTLSIEAPWYTYQKKLDALLSGDPEIIVSEIDDYPDDNGTDLQVNVLVYNKEKAIALDRMLKKSVDFGDIVLHIAVVDATANESPEAGTIALFKTIFKGNPRVSDFKVATDFCGIDHGYVCFVPEVLQFHDDDLTDYYGNWNGLAEDIASTVFEVPDWSVHFCTDIPTNAPVDVKGEEVDG